MKTVWSVLLAALFLLAGCKSKGPGETLEGYLNAIQQGDYDSFAGGLSYPGFSNVNADSLVFHLMEANKKLQEERYGGVKSFEIVNVKMNETADSATVRVKLHFGNETAEETEYEMVKSADVWKINLAI
ncbi:MAG: DUF4878 domain-containing protein [Bacteroidaceae bacterium]|nr:DUF4878 domain-containing protein [Bacteroidaceae bacterium]